LASKDQQEAPQQGLELSKEDQKVLQSFFAKADPKQSKMFLELISMQVRAFEGRPVDPEDVYTRLTNVKNILERSRFPTYTLIAKQVYLRLLRWKYGDVAQVCKEWADLEAESLISYKGLSRQEYTEQMKHAGQDMGPGAYFFGDRLGEQPTPKHRFWQKPKREESEFVYQ